MAVALGLVSSGCGEDEDATSAAKPAATEKRKDPRIPTVVEASDPHLATIAGGLGRTQPKIDPSGHPPPKRFILRDLRVGTGAVARRGDDAAVWYLGVDYRTGEVEYGRWYPSEPFVAGVLPVAGSGVAFNEGLVGMREGGSREMVIPSELAYGDGAMTYVAHLVRVERK